MFMYILTKNDKCSKYIQSEDFEQMCFFRFFFSLLIYLYKIIGKFVKVYFTEITKITHKVMFGSKLVENPQHRAEIMCYLFNR